MVQRVSGAAVSVHGDRVGSIGPGLCVLLGVFGDDEHGMAQRMAERLWHLRVFEDAAGRMNRSAAELRDLGARVATGRFGARMELSLVNDGPVTVILET